MRYYFSTLWWGRWGSERLSNFPRVTPHGPQVVDRFELNLAFTIWDLIKMSVKSFEIWWILSLTLKVKKTKTKTKKIKTAHGYFWQYPIPFQSSSSPVSVNGPLPCRPTGHPDLSLLESNSSPVLVSSAPGCHPHAHLSLLCLLCAPPLSGHPHFPPGPLSHVWSGSWLFTSFFSPFAPQLHRTVTLN